MPSPEARITFRLNDRGQPEPFADGRPVRYSACTVMSAIDKPTIARIDVILPDGMIVEEAPADKEAGQ